MFTLILRKVYYLHFRLVNKLHRYNPSLQEWLYNKAFPDRPEEISVLSSEFKQYFPDVTFWN